MRFDLNGLQLLSLNGCNVLFSMLKWFTQYLAALQPTGEFDMYEIQVKVYLAMGGMPKEIWRTFVTLKGVTRMEAEKEMADVQNVEPTVEFRLVTLEN